MFYRIEDTIGDAYDALDNALDVVSSDDYDAAYEYCKDAYMYLCKALLKLEEYKEENKI